MRGELASFAGATARLSRWKGLRKPPITRGGGGEVMETSEDCANAAGSSSAPRNMPGALIGAPKVQFRYQPKSTGLNRLARRKCPFLKRAVRFQYFRVRGVVRSANQAPISARNDPATRYTAIRNSLGRNT